MGVDIHIDTLEDLGITHGPDGIVGRRTGVLSGVGGASRDRLSLALQQLEATYKRGDHYSRVHQIPLDTIDLRPADPKSTDTFRFTLVYQYPQYGTTLADSQGEPRKEINGVVQSTQTNFFIEEIEFTGTEAEGLINKDHQIQTYLTDEDGERYETQGKLVELSKPSITLRFQRRETYKGGGPYETPGDKAYDFLWHINDDVWLGAAKHTVLCTELSATTMDNQTWLVTYGFQHDRDTWHVTSMHTDPTTGDPVKLVGIKGQEPNVKGAKVNEACRRFRIYPEADFSQLPI